MGNILLRIKEAVLRPWKAKPESAIPIIDLFCDAIDEIHQKATSVVKQFQQLNTKRVEQLVAAGFEEHAEVANYRLLQTEMNKAIDLAKRVNSYGELYPNYRFIPFATLQELCLQHNVVCVPFVRPVNLRIPDRALSQIVEFKVYDEDIWYSNYPANIIEFNSAKDAVRRHLSEIKQEDGSDPGLISGSLTRMPLYICYRTKTVIGAGSLHTECDEGEAIILHVLKGGFLVVTGWSTT